MPSGSYIQQDVLCPFYNWDDGKLCISCEGLAEESNIRLQFRHKKDWWKQVKTYCAKDYAKCPVCRILLEKYEERGA